MIDWTSYELDSSIDGLLVAAFNKQHLYGVRFVPKQAVWICKHSMHKSLDFLWAFNNDDGLQCCRQFQPA